MFDSFNRKLYIFNIVCLRPVVWRSHLKNVLNSGLFLETERYENFYKYCRYYFNHINTFDLCHEKYSSGRAVLL